MLGSSTKSSSLVLGAVGVLALTTTQVHGHGQMMVPKPREVTEKYRADCYAGLKGAGRDELQWAPVENLFERKQNAPHAPTFDIMNGCRGMVYEAGGPVTEVTAGEEIMVEYYIQAPHPGYLELWIVKPQTDDKGLIKYEHDGAVLKRIDNFAQNNNDKSTTVTIPKGLSGCNKAGDCALQFYWRSDLANQTYPTCADIIVKGGGGGGADSDNDKPSRTPAPSSSTPSRTPAPSSSTPTSSVPSSSGPSPSSTPTPKPSPTKKKCVRRVRRARE